MKRGYSYIYIYLAVYITVMMGWSFFYALNLATDEAVIINLISIVLFFIFINAIYLEIMRSGRQRSIFELWQIPIILWLGSLVLAKNNKMVGYAVIIFVSLLLLHNIISDKNKIHSASLLLLYVAAFVFIFGQKVLPTILIPLSFSIDTVKKYSYTYFNKINILPVSQLKLRIVVPMLAVMSVAMCYLLGMDTFEVNILLYYLGYVCILMFLINLTESTREFESMSAFYDLASYIEEERDHFAGILHDEIIQDIRASYNLLSLRTKDIETSKEILLRLERKSREMMNFYSSHVFEEYDIMDNLENLTHAIELLYPNRKIKIESDIDNTTIDILKDGNILKLALQITKEIINNIYKHSDATFINYRLNSVGNGCIKIIIESDGTTREDFDRILHSRGGILMIRLLVEKNGGQINYSLFSKILKTSVLLYSRGS